MKSKKLYLILPILTSLFCFLSLARLQKSEHDHQLKFKNLTERNLVRPLINWNAQFSICENYNPKTCQNAPASFPVDLSSQESIKDLYTKRPPSSNKVTLTHNASFADLAWIRERPITNLVVPSTQAIWLGMSFQNLYQSGYGLLRDYIFTLPRNFNDQTNEQKVVNGSSNMESQTDNDIERVERKTFELVDIIRQSETRAKVQNEQSISIGISLQIKDYRWPLEQYLETKRQR